MKSNCKKLSFTGFWLDLIHFMQYLQLCAKKYRKIGLYVVKWP